MEYITYKGFLFHMEGEAIAFSSKEPLKKFGGGELCV